MAIIKIWPPSPCVEDEDASLAREHGSDSSDSDPDHGKSPAASRGSVDQIPLIVDVNAKNVPTFNKELPEHESLSQAGKPTNTSKAGSSHTPQPRNEERRYVHVPPDSDTLGVPLGYNKPRSKSTTRLDGDETPRGRPHMHRLQTDYAGGDVHAMATGQRRAPSPYAHRPSPTVHQAKPIDRSKSTLLSPESSSVPPRPEVYSRRSRSARPERQSSLVDSSDSDRKSSRRTHRSKSRHGRSSEYKRVGSGSEEYFSDRRSSRRDSYTRSRPSPPQLRDSDKSHRSAHGDITPPQTPSLPRESPYVSAAEESDRRRRASSRRPERRYSKESSYSSSGENANKRRSNGEQGNAPPSRRSSMHRVNKPHLDLTNQIDQSLPTQQTPYAAQTPKAMEDYFQKAFEVNSGRQPNRTSQYSANPSPLSSPPTSQPGTPRGERNMKDYFEMNAPASPSKQSRSRPTSTEENSIKPLTSLLGAATLGASLATKVPSLSRSSTASLETPSSGSQGSMPSGQRSRKPSPVFDTSIPVNARPGSRAGSFTGREELNNRSNTISEAYTRPVSRAGSTASRDDHPQYRSSMYPVFDDRPSSRNGTMHTNGAEHPYPTQRAASYSSYDHQRTRPSSRRTYSTNGSTTIMPASSHHHIPGPSHLSRVSVSSSVPEKGPTPPTPVTPTSNAEERAPWFPKCPQPYPVTGHHQWYTIQGLQNFDICKSCASTVGGSEFRDYCVPSWKPPTEPITCALSRPYTRIAVARALKDKSANVNLLQELNTLPSGVLACPGSNHDLRRWYHVTDPTTKKPISNFDVCTACVRSIELLFPELRREKLFERPDGKLSQERTCNLNGGSKHFYPIIDHLDKLASWSRKKDLRPKDITNFGAAMRQKTRLRECVRDSMLATPLWHYMPRLPELTICEECYEEFVWPMRNMAIAKDVVPTLQKVPLQKPENYVAGISCQLYSERMRAIFKHACTRNDFDGLRQSALMRYNVEHKLQEKYRQLKQDMEQRGINRREEMERNSALWKTYE